MPSSFITPIILFVMESIEPHIPTIESQLPTITALQTDIDKVLDGLNKWTASLHVSCVVGSPGKLDLFQFTDPQYRVKKGGIQPVQFDPALYPPTDAGLQLLLTYLGYQGLTEGTVLNTVSD
jgi:hypothetical protein